MLGRFQQRLRGDTAHVQARTAERRLALGPDAAVDTGDAHPELSGPNSGRVTGRAGAKNNQIECFCHGHTRKMKRVGSSMSSLMATRKRTASRPSMIRWSYDRAKYIMGRITTLSPSAM